MDNHSLVEALPDAIHALIVTREMRSGLRVNDGDPLMMVNTVPMAVPSL
jgi:hypothetical protein